MNTLIAFHSPIFSQFRFLLKELGNKFFDFLQNDRVINYIVERKFRDELPKLIGKTGQKILKVPQEDLFSINFEKNLSNDLLELMVETAILDEVNRIIEKLDYLITLIKKLVMYRIDKNAGQYYHRKYQRIQSSTAARALFLFGYSKGRIGMAGGAGEIVTGINRENLQRKDCKFCELM